LLGKLNWISCTNQTPAQKFVGIFFDHFLEIDIISLLHFLFFFTFFLLIHKFKTVIRIIGFFIHFVFNVVFFLCELTYVLNEFVALLWKDR
jgi:hypothetical protein